MQTTARKELKPKDLSVLIEYLEDLSALSKGALADAKALQEGKLPGEESEAIEHTIETALLLAESGAAEYFYP